MTSGESRRLFLKKALLTTVATTSGACFVQSARAAEPPAFDPDADHIRPIDMLGIVPADHVVGGLLLQGEDDYLVFDAYKMDEFGSILDSGTAVIFLGGCLDWRFRETGDSHLTSHPVNPSELERFDTYEVLDSTWVKKLMAENPDSPLLAEGEPPMHHYVFTFAQTSFECVASELEPSLEKMSFDKIRETVFETD